MYEEMEDEVEETTNTEVLWDVIVCFVVLCFFLVFVEFYLDPLLDQLELNNILLNVSLYETAKLMSALDRLEIHMNSDLNMPLYI